MVHLKFYFVESCKFGKTYNIKLTHRKTILVARKIAKHFGTEIRKKQIYFTSYKNGRATPRYIVLPKEPDFYILIHEIGHYIDGKTRRPKHDKKFMKLLKKIHKFCELHHYWIKTELAIRRTELMINAEAGSTLERCLSGKC